MSKLTYMIKIYPDLEAYIKPFPEDPDGLETELGGHIRLNDINDKWASLVSADANPPMDPEPEIRTLNGPMLIVKRCRDHLDGFMFEEAQAIVDRFENAKKQPPVHRWPHD